MKNKIKKDLMHILGPEALSQDARRHLTESRPVTLTYHSDDKKISLCIEVEDDQAVVIYENEKITVPFVPYTDVDKAYFDSLTMDDEGFFTLPSDTVSQAYFERFEKAGLF